MNRKPRIGITMRLAMDTNRFYLGRDYSEALESLGAVPFHLSLIPNEEYVAAALEMLDGILLPGSDSDVDPLKYGEEPTPGLGKVVPEKDETDLLVIKEAERLKMPVLAICFGMQILNVARGGTLIQDIETEVKNCLKHEQGSPNYRNSHSLEAAEGKILSRLISKRAPMVNSSHHQSLKNVGKNLAATSWAKDGVIESIEDTREDRFVFGVQWHPELSWKFDELSKNIFQTFIGKGSEFSLNTKNTK